MRNLVETQWDHVRDGPLETVAYLARRTRVGRVCGLRNPRESQPFGAETSRLKTYGNRHDCVSDEELILPVQDQTAREMPTRFDGRDSGENGLRGLFDQFDGRRVGRFSAHPFLVISSHVHGTAESVCPFDVGGVEMRVGYHNRIQAAQPFDLGEVSELRRR